MKHVLINFYRAPSRIFMNNEGSFELLSREGTTQGCPLAMAMYALALVPLMKELQPLCKQVWYADDASGCDKFENLKVWFDQLLALGPRYGYYPSPEKCILVTKPQHISKARAIFKDTDISVQSDGSKDTGVKINTHGTRHLGAAVGTDTFKCNYVGKKVAHWVEAVEILSEIAATEPHAAYAAFTHALQCQWTFLSRVMPDAHDLFQPLEDVIRRNFIKAITRKDVNDLDRKMLSLPARLGGLGICNPVDACQLVCLHQRPSRTAHIQPTERT